MALRRHQVRVKKLNANEPLKTCRNELEVDKTVGCVGLAGPPWRITVYWPWINRHEDGRSFTQALIGNVRGFPVDVPIKALQEFFLENDCSSKDLR